VDAAEGFISTHVLDTQTGVPARGVRVRLQHLLADGATVEAGSGVTDLDGRIRNLVTGRLLPGAYRLTFDLHAYRETFFRTVTLEVHIDDDARGYHVPLLISAYSITSYRGS
jgi:5-hydroxyisourate hydrolase